MGDITYARGVVLHDDVCAVQSRRHRLTDAQRLQLAVLEQALHELTLLPHPLRCRCHHCPVVPLAILWIETTGEEDWPFSFHAVCVSLGLSPSAVRAKLRCR